MFKIAALVLGILAGANCQISCKFGTKDVLSEVSNCAACYTTTTSFLGVTATTYGCTASGLTCSPTSGTTCCTTNLCNAPGSSGGSGGSGGSGSLTCYNDLTGKSGSTQSDCTYCQRTATNLVFTTSVQQLCSLVCLPMDIGVTKTSCCQTNLCNGVSKVGIAWALVLPALATLVSLLA